jgi:hypothetical protein
MRFNQRFPGNEKGKMKNERSSEASQLRIS